MTLVKTASGLVVETDAVEAVPLPEWANEGSARLMLSRTYPDWRPQPLPEDWHGDGYKLSHAGSRTTIIVSASRWDRADVWVHASISHPAATPTYDELLMLHRAVFGHRFSYQVFAPPARHVNIHPHVLHLWGRDGDPETAGLAMPDFGRWGVI